IEVVNAPGDALDGATERDSWSRLFDIAHLYRQCRLHPRGMFALDEAGKKGLDVREAQAQLTEEWQQLVQDFRSARGGIAYLFGKRIDENTDPRELNPTAFPYVGPRTTSSNHRNQ